MLFASAAHAGDSVSYAYDAKGRLVKVVHTGTVNNSIQTICSHDKADNRSNVNATGVP